MALQLDNSDLAAKLDVARLSSGSDIDTLDRGRGLDDEDGSSSSYQHVHKSSLVEPPRFYFGVIPSMKTLALLQASFLGMLAAGAAAIAFCGYCMLIYLVLTRLYSPASVEIVRPLYFDYSNAHAVATTPLAAELDYVFDVPVTLPGANLLAAHRRAIRAGEQLSIRVLLQTPRPRGNELIQVTGELLTPDGKLVARSTRTWLGKRSPLLSRMLRAWYTIPLGMLGLYDDSQCVELVLFDRYTEKGSLPLAFFRAQLTGRADDGGGAPKLYKAEVRLKMRLGWLVSLMYWLRPGLLASYLIGLTGACLAVAGTAAATVLGLLALLLCSWMPGSDDAGTSNTRSRESFDMLSNASAAIGNFGTGEGSSFGSFVMPDYEDDVATPPASKRPQRQAGGPSGKGAHRSRATTGLAEDSDSGMDELTRNSRGPAASSSAYWKDQQRKAEVNSSVFNSLRRRWRA